LKMSIKRKLVLIMLLLSFVPLALLSVISIRYLSNSLEEAAINQTRELTNEVKLQIDGYLDRPLTAIRVIAGNPVIKAYDLDQIRPFLVVTQKSYPDVSFTLDDGKGNQVVRGDDVTLVNVWDRAYFQAALKGNEEAISEVLFSKNTNQFVINLGTPVRNTDTGAIIGVMQGSIALTKISEYVTNFSTQGSVAYVIDSAGKILAHPNVQLVTDRFDMSEQSFVKTALAEKRNGFSVVEDKTSGKKLVTYAFDKRTGWLICMEVPYSVITAKTHSLSLVLGAVTIAVLGLVGLLVLVLARRFADPILQLQQLASQVAQGDLTQKSAVHSSDEIGLLAKAFDAMVANLKKLISQVQENAGRVAAASEELTATAEQSAMAANQISASITAVADGADQQSQVVKAASDIVEHMSESFRQVAANTNMVSEQSARAASAAIEGGKSVESAVRQMLDLEQAVGASAQVVARLGERSKEIGQIVDTMSGIAGQTNLLALNAAIEAARAGEQGRGFAVVAEEVRKLAEQSQEAARQIGDMIGEIQGETDKAVAAMGQGTQGVKMGTEVVNQAGKAFAEIVGLVTQLADRVGEISLAIGQLAGGSQQIVSSVQEIDRLTKSATGEAQTVSASTEEQSAAMEEIASSSQSLAKMAQDLQAAVSKFRI